jgi:hypothetical protein
MLMLVSTDYITQMERIVTVMITSFLTTVMGRHFIIISKSQPTDVYA